VEEFSSIIGNFDLHNRNPNHKNESDFSYIMTASHCLSDETEGEIRVRVGQHSLLESTPMLNVSKIVMHKDYDTVSQFNDIALLRLTNPIQFTKDILPICLPPSDLEDPDGLFVAGWGRVDEGGRTSDKLHQISLPQYSSAKCEAKFGGLVSENHLCAGGVKGQDACQGDSGGPLTSRINNRVNVVGVVSWGIGLLFVVIFKLFSLHYIHYFSILILYFSIFYSLLFNFYSILLTFDSLLSIFYSGCAREDSPGVYTRVTSYLKWIEENTRDAKYCLSPYTNTTINEVADEPIQPNYQNCGTPNYNSRVRVVGGTEALPQEFPWTVIS